MLFGWEWWFTGENTSKDWVDWSQVDVPGGAFHTSVDFNNIWYFDSNDANSMSTISSHLRAGHGTSIGLYGPGGHAVTVWGFTHDGDDPTDYNGIYITDSDDYKYFSNAPDVLRYYDVEFHDNAWYLQNYYGSNSWFIGNVHALAMAPSTGDLDGNRDVDAGDIDLLAAAIRGGETDPDCDLNGDGLVDIADMDKLVRDIIGTEYGDTDLDHSVDLADFSALKMNFSKGTTWEAGDFNGDGIVGLTDFTILKRYYVRQVGVETNRAAVPEPATVLILTLGGIAVVSRRKRRC